MKQYQKFILGGLFSVPVLMGCSNNVSEIQAETVSSQDAVLEQISYSPSRVWQKDINNNSYIVNIDGVHFGPSGKFIGDLSLEKVVSQSDKKETLFSLVDYQLNNYSFDYFMYGINVRLLRGQSKKIGKKNADLLFRDVYEHYEQLYDKTHNLD